MGLRDGIAGIRFSRRLRLQYGLRSLLVAMLVICVSLGWYVEHVRRQQLAVAGLREAGAYLAYHNPDGKYENPETFALDGSIEKPQAMAEWAEWMMPNRLRSALGIDSFRRVESVELYYKTDHARAVPYLRDLRGLQRLGRFDCALDDDLAAIGTLSALTTLHLGSDSAITDKGLVHLGRLRGLESLKLRGQPITDAGLEHLAKLTRLKILDLSETSIGDAGLWQLANLLDLESLDLSGAKITGDGLAVLAKLRRLKYLDLSRTAIGDAGLSRLTNMPNLEFLGLSSTGITDEGLAPLRSLPHLKELDLSETVITDTGLHVLADVTSLESVNLYVSAATPDGTAWLERRLPQCKVASHAAPRGGAYLLSRPAVFLLRAERWREALEAISKLDDGTVPPFQLPGLWARSRGRCYAELGEWDLAEREYLTAFEQLSHPRAGYISISASASLWQELENWPRLTERVARNCPEDAWRWVARAERAVLNGRWPDAAENYARAAKYAEGLLDAPENHAGEYTRVVFDYGASCLLAGDLAEPRRLCDRLLEAEQRGVDKDPPSDNLFAAVRLAILAPRSAIAKPVIQRAFKWDCWWINDVKSLVNYRGTKFQEALEPYDPKGLDWFSIAMSYHQLGRVTEARASFARGARWLERSMKIARIRGDFDEARRLLCTEVLRREAERSIFLPD